MGESCRRPGELEVSSGLATSSSASACVWSKDMARGVLSSRISSSDLSCIGGSFESPSVIVISIDINA